MDKGASPVPGDRAGVPSGLSPASGSQAKPLIPSAGEWSFCQGPAHRAACTCMTVMNDHHPICKVTSGEWGDEFPAIRVLPDEGGTKAEAYMERYLYGHVSEEQAIVHLRLIAAAPDLYAACIAWLSAWGNEAAEISAIRQMEAAVRLAQGGVTEEGGKP